MLQHEVMMGDVPVFSEEVLDRIASENLWNIWVPKEFGGLELGFKAGLSTLYSLARQDGSLGWTVTLCSGANYFIGNLMPEVAKELFAQPVIFGGSGGMFGSAEKVGDSYRLHGKWRYATGAPYLTHFTLNARIHENGVALKNEDGTPKLLSFILPASKVTIIEDWNTMGLKATATHSFEVNQVLVHERYSFVYNQFYLDQPIFKIHFSVFADLTLWVNYLGMAEHLLDITQTLENPLLEKLKSEIYTAKEQVEVFATQVEEITKSGHELPKDLIQEIHLTASESVKELAQAFIAAYPYLGVKASRADHVINLIFRDFFTATQHHIFHTLPNK